MKKLRLFIFLMLFASVSIFALSIEDILKSAYSASYTVKNAELTHDNSILLLEENDLEDKTIWSFDISVTPFDSRDFISESLDVTTLNASVTLPNSGNTTLTLSSPFDAGYDGAFLIRPGIEVSHKFDFNYFDDDLISDLDNAKNRIATERTYLNAIYSFYKTTLSQVQTLLTLEKNIKSLEHDIDNAETDLNNMLVLKTANEESISYKREKMALEKNKRSLSNYLDQYEKAKEQFLASTDLEWNGLEDFNVPTLKLNELESGNSLVVESGMEAEIALLNIEEKESEMNPFALNLIGDVSSVYRNDKNIDRTLDENNGAVDANSSFDASIAAELEISSWKIGTVFNSHFDDGFDFTPSLSFYGSWTSNNEKEKDRLELERLRNTAIKEQNEYLDEMTSYKSESMSLQNRILSYEFDLENALDNEEYLYSVYESEKEYYENGLVRKRDVDDALFNAESAHYDSLITYIDGLILYFDILIFSL